MGKIRHDDCQDRWTTEAIRLVMYRRQYARLTDTAADAAQPDDLAALVADAERLAEHIVESGRLMRAIEDEHNGHTVGTWTHTHRPAHIPVSA